MTKQSWTEERWTFGEKTVFKDSGFKARLIALAPEMAEALRAIHAHVSNGDYAPAIIKAITSAILAKLEGGR